MKNGKRIVKIEIERMFDESPDTSWMGEFSNCADTQFAIDHQERSESNRVRLRGELPQRRGTKPARRITLYPV